MSKPIENNLSKNPVDEIIFRLNAIWKLKEHYEMMYQKIASEKEILLKTIDEYRKKAEVKSIEIEEIRKELQISKMNLDRAYRENSLNNDRFTLNLDKLRDENSHLRALLNCSDNNSINKDNTISYTEVKRKIEGARQDANRILVEQLIEYAEKEDKNVAREIRFALTTKMANGYIAKDFLNKEYKQRLENLGRETSNKNNGINFNESVSTVVGHADKVIIKHE